MPNIKTPKILGVLAGKGNLPKMLFEKAKKNKQKIFFVFVETNPEFELDKSLYIKIAIGQVGKALSFLKKNNIKDIVLAGGVTKPNLYKVKVDFRGALLIAKILKSKLLGDNNLLTTVASFLEERNIKVHAVNDLVENLHLSKGFNNKINVPKKILKHFESDLEFAQNIIATLSRFDIGQSIIVQHSRVIGIEAAEGTDNLIKRCSPYIEDNKNYPAFLLKLKKTTQDKRLDLPTIGMDTIDNLCKNNISGVVIDAENVLVIDKDKICKYAENKNIFIYGV